MTELKVALKVCWAGEVEEGLSEQGVSTSIFSKVEMTNLAGLSHATVSNCTINCPIYQTRYSNKEETKHQGRWNEAESNHQENVQVLTSKIVIN